MKKLMIILCVFAFMASCNTTKPEVKIPPAYNIVAKPPPLVQPAVAPVYVPSNKKIRQELETVKLRRSSIILDSLQTEIEYYEYDEQNGIVTIVTTTPHIVTIIDNDSIVGERYHLTIERVRYLKNTGDVLGDEELDEAIERESNKINKMKELKDKRKTKKIN